MAVSYNFRPISQDGLVLYFDAANRRSYTPSGLAVFNIAGQNSGVLLNGVGYSSSNGGSLAFDGTNDLISLTTSAYPEWTIAFWLKTNIEDGFLGSSRDFFYNIPPSGASTEGYLRVADDLFYNVNTCYIDANNDIYVGGQYGGYNDTVRPTITKINSDGSLNTSFDAGVFNASVYNCASIVEYNSGIYAAGTNLTGTGIAGGSAGLMVLNKFTGVSSGTQTNNAAGGAGPNICSSIQLDSINNAIYLGGVWAATYQNHPISGLLKINIDTKAPVTQFVGGFNTTAVNAIRLDASGDIYAVGGFTTYKGTSANRIVKINKTDGSIDTSFNYGTGFSGGDVNDIRIDANGRLLVAGNFTSYNGTSINRIVRLTTSGTIDSTFNAGTGFNLQVRRMQINPVRPSAIMAVGDFTSYNGTTANRIVRLTSSGTIDSNFSTGTGFNASVTDVGFTTGESLIVVGNSFTTYNGFTTPASICRLTSSGTYDTTFQPSGFNIPLYRGRFETRLAGGVSQNNFGGTFGISAGRNIFSITGGSNLWQNFNYLTITFSTDKNFRFYRNGVLTTTLAATSAANCNLSLNQLFFRDNLYAFQLYGKALSLAEIQKNYNITRLRLGA